MATRRTRMLATAWAAGCLALCLPVAASLYAAWVQGRSEADAALHQFTANMLRRAATLRMQTNTAIDQLAAQDSGAACTPADIDHMRQVAAAHAYLQGIGRLRGNLLQCSTLAGTGPVDLGPPDRSYPIPGAPQAWDHVALPGIARPQFSITGRLGYAAIALPELVSDIAVPPGVVLAQFAMGDHKVLRANGTIDSAWLQRFAQGDSAFEDAQGRRVAIQVSDLGYTAAVAAMPAALAQSYVRSAAGRTLPAGLALGALLALAVALYAHYLLSMKGRLRRALRRREFHLVYQPVVDLRDGRCVGAEALIRWAPPDGAAVSPVVFIPAAEAHGLIQEVTAQVMDMVARDAVALIGTYPDAHIAINFSAEDLHSPAIEGRLQDLLSQAGADSRNIMIEATERGLMNPEKARGTLLSVRAQGFKVAIDDFGTGSSSLSYLATYDLDVLKIDKMFVDAFETALPTTKVALHIIEIARTLDLEMIAEGVETARQRDILRDAGVQYAQGWFFARPMPMVELLRFMRTSRAADNAGGVA